MSNNGYNKTQLALMKAVRMLCTPLIRLLIEKSITFPQLRDLLKEIYVEVAEKDFSLDDKKPSDSRIFVLTGIHRKDIKRIRQQDQHEYSSVTTSASLSGEIIARWMSMPEFLDDKGKAKALLKNSKDDEADFEALVSSVNKDVRPKVILEEWLRLDIVRLKDDHIVLNKSAFVSSKAFNDMAYYLGHNVHDHMASCVNNILNEDEPMLERSVYYAHLTKDSINKLKAISDKKSDELLRQLNKQAIKFYDADKQKDEAIYRMRLGVYWHHSQLDNGNDTNTEPEA